jgi:hypothetical protein
LDFHPTRWEARAIEGIAVELLHNPNAVYSLDLSHHFPQESMKDYFSKETRFKRGGDARVHIPRRLQELGFPEPVTASTNGFDFESGPLPPHQDGIATVTLSLFGPGTEYTLAKELDGREKWHQAPRSPTPTAPDGKLLRAFSILRYSDRALSMDHTGQLRETILFNLSESQRVVQDWSPTISDALSLPG